MSLGNRIFNRLVSFFLDLPRVGSVVKLSVDEDEGDSKQDQVSGTAKVIGYKSYQKHVLLAVKDISFNKSKIRSEYAKDNVNEYYWTVYWDNGMRRRTSRNNVVGGKSIEGFYEFDKADIYIT